MHVCTYTSVFVATLGAYKPYCHEPQPSDPTGDYVLIATMLFKASQKRNALRKC